jgi:AmiR/NasT family two-component response regulator
MRVIAERRVASQIVVVDESPIRTGILDEGVREAWSTGVGHIMQSLLARFYALDPDVILIDLENPKRDVLEQMFQVSRAVRQPIAMFVDQTHKRAGSSGTCTNRPISLKCERIKFSAESITENF